MRAEKPLALIGSVEDEHPAGALVARRAPGLASERRMNSRLGRNEDKRKLALGNQARAIPHRAHLAPDAGGSVCRMPVDKGEVLPGIGRAKAEGLQVDRHRSLKGGRHGCLGGRRHAGRQGWWGSVMK